MAQYKILMHTESFNKAASYLKGIFAVNTTPGSILAQDLANKDLSNLSVEAFIELIVRTKQPQIFAEFSVYGDGSDWNQAELSILGDISIAAPVTVYDNGIHSQPEVYDAPFGATLIYTPGALLKNGTGNQAADWGEITVNDQIDSEAYCRLYERRLLPSFIYANDIAGSVDKKAFITIPGLGCGQFAGRFRGDLGLELRNALIQLLRTHGGRFPNIKAVYFDSYRECKNERLKIGDISFFVRPLTKGNEDKSQLCRPTKYEEDGDDFSDCELFSLVAWDHVSWPGNDFYIGSRATDDGVKAAATNSMAVMTGVEGCYNKSTHKYEPPKKYDNWRSVVLDNKITLDVKNNLMVLPA